MKKYFNEHYKEFLSFSVVIALLVVGYFSIKAINARMLEKHLKDIDWLRGNISLIENEELGKDIYSIKRNEHISIYSLEYRNIVKEYDNLIKEKIPNEYIIIYNPFGTNKLSFNIYFREKVSDVSYNISVNSKKIDDFSRTLIDKDDDYYQLIGFVPGYVNKLTLKYTKDGKEKKEVIDIDMRNVTVNSKTILKSTNGKSEKELSDGLYVILGNDSDLDDYVSFYDNNGVVRGEIPIIGYRAHSILFRDDKMYFSISQTKIVEVNNLGEVTDIFETGKYQLHHDYIFDDDGNLLVLANNTKKPTEEDCVIKIDLKTKEVTEVIDFQDIFTKYVETCVLDTTGARDEGEDGLDWLHINSIDYIDGDIIISSRETSSIIKVKDIYGEKKIEYILGSKDFWKDTEFSEYVYSQVGDFTLHGGQHFVRYEEGEEDYYYLTFYNNNYGRSNSKPKFNWSNINIKNNNSFTGDKSYYYKYKVNEEEKTFELVDSFGVIYSGIVSSAQTLDNKNILMDSGTAGVFAEYDDEHKLIKKFDINLNKYMVYRVLKYDFNNFYFK